MSNNSVIGLYQRHARQYDRDRGRSLQERAWLDRFLGLVSRGERILDIGCGMGEPIAAYLLECEYAVTGVDGSAAMIEICRARFPESEWLVGDMRTLDLGRRFGGLLAWDSFFHLTAEEQRAMFPRFARHAKPGAPLMFTSGPAAGVAIGEYGGERLYHASLDPEEYRMLLAANGFAVRNFAADDPQCGNHTIWLAAYQGDVPR